MTYNDSEQSYCRLCRRWMALLWLRQRLITLGDYRVTHCGASGISWHLRTGHGLERCLMHTTYLFLCFLEPWWHSLQKYFRWPQNHTFPSKLMISSGSFDDRHETISYQPSSETVNPAAFPSLIDQLFIGTSKTFDSIFLELGWLKPAAPVGHHQRLCFDQWLDRSETVGWCKPGHSGCSRRQKRLARARHVVAHRPLVQYRNICQFRLWIAPKSLHFPLSTLTFGKKSLPNS